MHYVVVKGPSGGGRIIHTVRGRARAISVFSRGAAHVVEAGGSVTLMDGQDRMLVRVEAPIPPCEAVADRGGAARGPGRMSSG